MPKNTLPTETIKPQQEDLNKQFYDSLLDKIIENGKTQTWLKGLIDRNQVTIDALIENDTFGSLSDFKELYPNASTKDQVYILKGFLSKEKNYGQYHIDELTSALMGWMDNHVGFEHSLDRALLDEKLARRISWSVDLSNNTKALYDMLSRWQILHKLATMQQASNLNDAKLKEWIKSEQQNLFNKINDANIAPTNEFAFLFGSRSFAYFFQKEIRHLKSIFTTFLGSVNDIANTRAIDDALKSFILALAVGYLSTVKAGLFFLLPYRLAITTLRESSFHLSKYFYKAADYLVPEARIRRSTLQFAALALQVSAIIFGMSYFQLPWMLLMGLQLFPQSWTYGFIGKLILSISAATLASGALYGVGKAVVSYVKQWWSPASPAAQQEPLSTSQRQRLMIALNQYRANLAADSSLEEADKQSKSKTLNSEIQQLFRQDQPYFLSQFDKEIIRQRNVTGFDNHIKPHTSSAKESADQNKFRATS